jgi:hypothetical protein
MPQSNRPSPEEGRATCQAWWDVMKPAVDRRIAEGNPFTHLELLIAFSEFIARNEAQKEMLTKAVSA